MEDYEVEQEFPGIGQRTMCLNARKVFYEKGPHTTILLGIEDVTRQRVLRDEKDELIRQKDVLLEQKVMLAREFDHRLLNSMQLISSLLSLQSRTTKNPEAAAQLSIAGNRVASLGRVHRRLHVLDHLETVEFKQYISRPARTFPECFRTMPQNAPSSWRARISKFRPCWAFRSDLSSTSW